MSLDVYLYGERVGTLFPAGDNDYRLAYDPELVERVGPGKALLSNSLPARPEPYSAEATRAYVEGLLPEGPRRERIGPRAGPRPDRRLPAAGRAGPGLPRRGHLPARRGGSAVARPRLVRLVERGRTGGSGEAAPAAPVQRRPQAADALRPARPPPQAQPRPRRGWRPLGLAGGRRPEHARDQARDRRIPRIRRQRDVLHDRLPPGRPARRQSDGGADRRPALPGLAALRPGRRRGRHRRQAAPLRVLLPGARHPRPPRTRRAPRAKRPAGPKPAGC